MALISNVKQTDIQYIQLTWQAYREQFDLISFVLLVSINISSTAIEKIICLWIVVQQNEPRSLMTWVFCRMSDKDNDQINIKIPFLIRTTIGTHVLHINCPRHRIQNGKRLQYDRDDIG